MKDNTYHSLFYKSLGEVLVKLRNSRGRTFEDVAFVIDVHPMTFYKYETGARKIPIDVFRKLCAFYNVKMDDILDEVHEKVKKQLCEKKDI